MGRPYNKSFQRKLSKKEKSDVPATVPKRSDGSA